jgi:hypothetical protein
MLLISVGDNVHAGGDIDISRQFLSSMSSSYRAACQFVTQGLESLAVERVRNLFALVYLRGGTLLQGTTRCLLGSKPIGMLRLILWLRNMPASESTSEKVVF